MEISSGDKNQTGENYETFDVEDQIIDNDKTCHYDGTVLWCWSC